MHIRKADFAGRRRGTAGDGFNVRNKQDRYARALRNRSFGLNAQTRLQSRELGKDAFEQQRMAIFILDRKVSEQRVGHGLGRDRAHDGHDFAFHNRSEIAGPPFRDLFERHNRLQIACACHGEGNQDEYAARYTGFCAESHGSSPGSRKFWILTSTWGNSAAE